MFKRRTWLVIIPVILFSVGSTRAQTVPASGLYQIISGNYIECCGLAGDFHWSLPNKTQSYVKLVVDPHSKLAAMTFLGEDMETVFSVITCPDGDRIGFSFNQGLVFTNGIVFHVDPGPPPHPVYWNYAVSNSADSLRIDGTLGILQQLCLDVPDRFSHSNVVAVLMPTAAIRVSEIEVCWHSVTNRTYQVQYRSALTTNVWTDLGGQVAGNDSTRCVADRLPSDQPQRFYRVLTSR